MQGDHHATYRLTKETATQGNVTYVAQYTYDDVGNRLSMSVAKSDGSSNPLSQSVIAYEYDANDRLTKSTLQGPPPFVAMAKTADDLYAESSSRRSHNGMKAFALAALGTLCVPVLLMRSRHRPLGRRARRRRIVNSAMLVFMALLMAVGPENVQAAYLNSALYQSLAAAGLAQTDTTPPKTVWHCRRVRLGREPETGWRGLDGRKPGICSTVVPMRNSGQPSGHGRVPTVFWAAECARGRERISHDRPAALTLMGDWRVPAGHDSQNNEDRGAYQEQ